MTNLKNLCETLASSATLTGFGSEVEKAVMRLAEVSKARYFVYSEPQDHLLSQGDLLAVDLATQPGYCAFFREPTREALPVPGLANAEGAESLPVTHFGRLSGVLTVVTEFGRPAGPELESLVEVLGLLQDVVSNREELRDFTDRTRDLLVVSVEAILGIPGHVGRVARLATELASLLDLSAQMKAQLFRAAHYHDVGMLSLQTLSRAEARRAHGDAGAEFLRTTRSLSDLAELVEHHHERFDGSGFPKGLEGSQLPIDGWVLPLAEHLEEFLQARSNLSFEDALRTFFDNHASSHHPEVVDALCGLIDSGRLHDVFGVATGVAK